MTRSLVRWRSRIAVLVVASAVLAPMSALAQPAPDGKAALADGDKAAKAKDWKAAALSYDASNKAAPTEAALDGFANASYQAGDLGHAWTAYTEWLDKYGAKTPAKKKAAEARLKELTEKTGGVTIAVNEANATIQIDEKPIGTSPFAGPLRLTAGPHHIKITKDGFIAFDQTPNIAGGGTTPIDAKLIVATTKARVTVKEKSGRAVRVVIDGVDMGDAPWTGDLEAGPHDVMVRSTGFVSPTAKLTLERGKAEQVDLTAMATSAPVKVATTDGKGLIYLDGKLVGEGTYVGELPAGTHQLRITREGYDPIEEEVLVSDKDPVNRNYTLKLSSKIETQAISAEVDRLEGLYTGFTLNGFLTPAGTGSVFETQCEEKDKIPTLASCTTPDGLGAGLGGFVGYHWDPVGVELALSGSYDTRKIKNTWLSSTPFGGITGDPARTEEVNIRRTGGMLLARVRVAKQWKSLRLMFPIGAGVAYRVMFLDRDTKATATGATDTFHAGAETYLSPVIALEPSIALRVTSGVAISLGVDFHLETPGSLFNGNENPITKGERTHRLGNDSISTPTYLLASNVQSFIGPVIGMMFGP